MPAFVLETHDDEFERVELTFKEFEQSVKQLTEDAKAFKQQVKSTCFPFKILISGHPSNPRPRSVSAVFRVLHTDILDHQKGFGTALQVYYEMDETGKASEMLPVCHDYVAQSAKWTEEMTPWMVCKRWHTH